jgi:uncharacterized membrane protein
LEESIKGGRINMYVGKIKATIEITSVSELTKEDAKLFTPETSKLAFKSLLSDMINPKSDTLDVLDFKYSLEEVPKESE